MEPVWLFNALVLNNLNYKFHTLIKFDLVIVFMPLRSKSTKEEKLWICKRCEVCCIRRKFNNNKMRLTAQFNGIVKYLQCRKWYLWLHILLYILHFTFCKAVNNDMLNTSSLSGIISTMVKNKKRCWIKYHTHRQKLTKVEYNQPERLNTSLLLEWNTCNGRNADSCYIKSTSKIYCAIRCSPAEIIGHICWEGYINTSRFSCTVL